MLNENHMRSPDRTIVYRQFTILVRLYLIWSVFTYHSNQMFLWLISLSTKMERHDLHPSMETLAWAAFCIAGRVLHGVKCGLRTVESFPPPSHSTAKVCVLHDLMLQVWNFPLLSQFNVWLLWHATSKAEMLCMEKQAILGFILLLNTPKIAWIVFCITAYLKKAPTRVCCILCLGPYHYCHCPSITFSLSPLLCYGAGFQCFIFWVESFKSWTLVR